MLGGSWVVVVVVVVVLSRSTSSSSSSSHKQRLISPLVWVMSIVTLLISPFISTHEPPSSAL